jgi:hypothetical protein
VPAAGPLEAYEFDYKGEGFTRLVIAWRNGEGPAVPLRISADHARVIDSMGREMEIRDGETGDADLAAGTLGIPVDIHPVFMIY